MNKDEEEAENTKKKNTLWGVMGGWDAGTMHYFTLSDVGDGGTLVVALGLWFIVAEYS
jgi:hypothetical protein